MSVTGGRQLHVEGARRRRWLAFLAAGAPPVAMVLCYLSLLPIAVLLVLAITADAGTDREALAEALLLYVTMLVTFLAGIRWGNAMRADAARSDGLAVTILAPLVAGAALFVSQGAAAGLLAATLAAQGAWDVWSAERGRLPLWYGRLRARTTPVAVVLMVAAVILLAAAAD